GGTQHAETLSQAGTGTAARLRHPGQRQSGLGQGLPERRFPAAILVAVDGLRVGKIRKYLFRGLDDNILNFRQSVPRFRPAYLSAAISPGFGCGFSWRA